MKNKQLCDLNSCFLCTHCLKEWIPAIGSHRQTIPVKKGGVIFEEGDTVKGIYFVYQGKVKVHKKWGTDKELILRMPAMAPSSGIAASRMTISIRFQPLRWSLPNHSTRAAKVKI